MGMERQQRTGEQLDLFAGSGVSAHHGVSGEGGTHAGTGMESQVNTAKPEGRALAMNLMEKSATRENLHPAMKQVCRDKGVGGVDGMTVDELRPWYSCAHGLQHSASAKWNVAQAVLRGHAREPLFPGGITAVCLHARSVTVVLCLKLCAKEEGQCKRKKRQTHLQIWHGYNSSGSSGMTSPMARGAQVFDKYTVTAMTRQHLFTLEMTGFTG